MSVTHLTSTDAFQAFVDANRGKVCVIDFYANWCTPCMKIRPAFEQWATTETRIQCAAVNIDDDDGEELMEENGVAKLPTFVVIDRVGVSKAIEDKTLVKVRQHVAALLLEEGGDF